MELPALPRPEQATPSATRPPDDVVHHQEIMGESHLLDHAELLLEQLHGSGRHRLVEAGDAPEAALGQKRVGRLALGDVDAWEVEGAQLEIDVAALGDEPRGVERPTRGADASRHAVASDRRSRACRSGAPSIGPLARCP